jgi:hypothetical protein
MRNQALSKKMLTEFKETKSKWVYLGGSQAFVACLGLFLDTTQVSVRGQTPVSF